MIGAGEADRCGANILRQGGLKGWPMSQDHQTAVVERAREVLGDGVQRWMTRQNRYLAGLTPQELAQSPEGARVVLLELDRHRQLA